MILTRRVVALIVTILGATQAGWSQIQLSGTLESNFVSNNTHRGFYHASSWGELNLRVDPISKFTVSTNLFTGSRQFDEVCYEADLPGSILRVGRMRTAFGLNNWSDVAYTGFNQQPIVTSTPLAGGLALFRDDSGVEFTVGGPELQAQAAVIDTNIKSNQISPGGLNHGSLRLQTEQGPLIVGVNLLKGLQGLNDIYGLDLLFTRPHFLVRGEAMTGRGEGPGRGFFLDASYRFPQFDRTELVARTESFQYENDPTTYLNTLGIRQFATKYLTLVANYTWGSGPNAGQSAYGGYGVTGWSFRAMVQTHF